MTTTNKSIELSVGWRSDGEATAIYDCNGNGKTTDAIAPALEEHDERRVGRQVIASSQPDGRVHDQMVQFTTVGGVFPSGGPVHN